MEFNDETGAMIPSPEEVLKVQKMKPVIVAVREEVQETVYKIIKESVCISSEENKKEAEDVAFQMSYT